MRTQQPAVDPVERPVRDRCLDHREHAMATVDNERPPTLARRHPSRSDDGTIGADAARSVPAAIIT
jgi:hypothetical protein